MAKFKFSIENWKGKRFVVARSNGKFVTFRNIDGSRFQDYDLSDFKRIYSDTGTFYENKYKRKLTNVSEVVQLENTSLNDRFGAPVKKPRVNNPQYIVSGFYRGKEVHARSLKLGTPLCETRQQCKDYAWKRFMYVLGAKVAGKEVNTDPADLDRGLRSINQVYGIREGWVYYS